MENGHGSLLGGAGALGEVGRSLLAMHLGSARGRPVRLKSRQVGLLLCEGNMVEVVSEVLVSVFVDVGHDEENALK